MDLKPKSLFKRVINFARGERPERVRRVRDSVTPAAPEGEQAYETSSAREGGSSGEGSDRAGHDGAGLDVVGLEVAHRGDGVGGVLLLRWSIGPDEVARAGALVDGQPVLCLRVVSFSKARDDVLREVQDRPGIDLSGECEINEPTQRAIVALGLRAGDRFVSIAHHVI